MTDNNVNTVKPEKSLITGKQVLSDCATLVKHLGAYVVCVTVRAVKTVKGMIAAKKSKKADRGENDAAAGGATA